MVKIGMTCMKYLLFVFNLMFVVGGIFLIVVGVIVKVKQYTIIGDTTYVSMPIIIITLGAGIFVLAFFGCCGAIKENIFKLVVYGFLVVVLLILQITGLAMAYANSGKMEEVIKENMKNTLKSHKNDSLKSWDYMNKNFQCCGVDGPKDYTDDNLDIPGSCCKEEDAESCTEKKAFEDGCYYKLVAFIMSNLKIVAGVGGIIAAVEIVSAIFSFCMVSYIRQDNQARSPTDSSSPLSYRRY